MPEQNHQDGRNQKPPRSREQNGPQGSPWTLVIWIVVTTLLVLWMWGYLVDTPTDQPHISYTEFRAELREGNIERVTLKGDRVEGELESPARRTTADGERQEYTSFVTYVPAFGDDQLLAMLDDQGVEVSTEPESDFIWWPFLLTGLPLLLLIIIGFFIWRRMRDRAGGQGLFSIGQNKAKLQEQTDEKTTFEDVAGADGAKVELQEVVTFLKNPDRFKRFGAEVPKGVLLVGPPGTGKTLLARAVAGEAGVPFYTITGSDFMEMFVGVGASRVRNMFKEARKNKPCIIFIDELDSIGRRRGAGLGGGHDEREQTLNQLLAELDGFEPMESVIVMAATNRPDILDPALLRPGRFDRQITVDSPTQNDRLEILKIHARNKPLAEGIDLESIAKGTPGFSGADLKNLLNEAALLAAREDKEFIEQEDVEGARDKITMGLERTGMTLDEEELELIAYHEAGHALVAATMPNTDPIHKVSIVPRGRAMGVTQQLPEREKYVYRREYMLDRIAVIMGGRAAEDLVYDTATSGAENDFKQATQLARSMVFRWGMGERVGRMSLDGREGQVFLGEEISQRRQYSEETARQADEEVRAILEEAYERAVEALGSNRDVLDRLAEVLIEREEVTGEEVMALLRGEPLAAAGDGVSQENVPDFDTSAGEHPAAGPDALGNGAEAEDEEPSNREHR